MICMPSTGRVAIVLLVAWVLSQCGILIYFSEQEQNQQERTNAQSIFSSFGTRTKNTAHQPQEKIIDSRIDISSRNLKEQCLHNRGTHGFWYRDEDFARKTFFRYGFRSNKWARTNDPKRDVYPGNSYNWKDTSLIEEPSCQIHPVNMTSFCNIMQKLDIRRLFFVGDSLSDDQLRSLLGLIGLRPDDYFKNSRKAVIKETSINCPDYAAIEVEYYRENLGPNFGKLNVTGRVDATLEHMRQFAHEIPYCIDQNKKLIKPLTMGDYCPWHLRYNQTNVRTLLVLNQGAHFHSMETFVNSFDQFITLFNSIAHSGDYVVLRNTVPGHYDCMNTTANTKMSKLNMTHDIFLERYGTTMYDWNLFDAYNRYAKQTMMERLTPKVTSHYLNVYNMTVLRPDEHVSGTDCLHYMHPGPIDFWNHLLFTNLEDLSELENKQK